MDIDDDATAAWGQLSAVYIEERGKLTRADESERGRDENDDEDGRTELERDPDKFRVVARRSGAIILQI